MSDLTATTGTWTLDPSHTVLGFSARHAMVSKVKGRFTDFDGTITLDGADPAISSATLTVRTASIDSRNADRDAHLTSPDFLDVETFPTLTFVSTDVLQKTDDQFVVTGDLTIRGVTRSIDVPWTYNGVSTDPWGGTRIGFEAVLEISRKEWGLVWNVALEAGGVLVGDKVKLELDVEAVKAVKVVDAETA